MTTSASCEDDAPFQPDEDWIDSFKQQCTDDLRLDLRAYASRRARGVRRCGGQVTDTYPEDLVADALADTLFGVVAWNPKAKSLYQHVEDTIRFRTRHDREHAKRYKHHRIDAPASTTERQATRGLVEASIAQDRSDETADAVIFAHEVLERLLALSAGDDEVLRFLDAIVNGAETRAQIMEITKMSMKTFRNARERLGRLIDQLDQRVVTDMRYVLGVRA